MTRPPYSPEFRRPMVDLVRAGQSPEALSREFEPTAHSVGAWVVAADKRDGKHHMRTELVLDAMEAAIGQRRPKDVIHHSD